jgi:fumarate reductase subunit C
MGDGGVTLGAVFALMYGPVRALMSEDERFRFVGVAAGPVVVVVVVVALAFMYRRFIRSGEGSPA